MKHFINIVCLVLLTYSIQSRATGNEAQCEASRLQAWSECSWDRFLAQNRALQEYNHCRRTLKGYLGIADCEQIRKNQDQTAEQEYDQCMKDSDTDYLNCIEHSRAPWTDVIPDDGSN